MACDTSRTVASSSARRTMSECPLPGLSRSLTFHPPDRPCPSPRPLEEVHPLAVRRRDPPDGLVAREPLGPVFHQRVPERRPADREADEPRDPRGGRQPLPDLLVVLAAAQDD